MDPVTWGDTSAVIGGIAVLLIAIPAALLLSFLLFITPLMVWLNLRRLRVNLHADLAALKESVDRLAGIEPAAEQQVPAAEPAQGSAVPPEVPAAQSEKIGFSCPGCGKFFEGPSALAGSNYTCPECGVEFHIH